MQPQVVHEAEVHRQHVRLKIPINVEIDGSAFTVDDWSMGGFGIFSEMTSRQPGERFPVKLIFPFEDFEVTLRLDCQMVYILEESTRFGCRFLGLSQGQLALFRYLVDAYLSGEIVSGGDILAIAGRENSAAVRERGLPYNPYAEAEGVGRRVKQIAGYTLVNDGFTRTRDDHKGTVGVTLTLLDGTREVATLEPSRNFYFASQQDTTEVALHSTFRRDVYVVLAGLDESGLARVAVFVNPLVMWLWIAGLIITFGGIVAAWPERRRPGRPDATSEEPVRDAVTAGR